MGNYYQCQQFFTEVISSAVLDELFNPIMRCELFKLP